MNFSIFMITVNICWLMYDHWSLSSRIRMLCKENISLETKYRNLHFRLIEIEDWKDRVVDHMNKGESK